MSMNSLLFLYLVEYKHNIYADFARDREGPYSVPVTVTGITKF